MNLVHTHPAYTVLAGAIALAFFMRAMAGRMAPRVAIAPVVFLFTRTPVLVAGLFGSVLIENMLVHSAIQNGHPPYAHLSLLAGVSLFSGFGFGLLVVGPVFFISRLFKEAPAVELESGEVLVRQMLANHFRLREARGGKLLLTDRRLVFRPHRFNIQLDTWSLPYSQIASVASEGRRFLVIKTASGGEEWLVVRGAAEIAQELQNKARAAAA